MTLARNGFTVSRRFEARKTAGECPQCNAGIVAGQPTAFLKSHMGEDGRADRAMHGEETRAFNRLFRAAQGIARSRGILPRTTRNGRRARNQRPASLQEVGTAPSWLFDHMVHWNCLPEFAGGPTRRTAETVAAPGSRTAGAGHGVAAVTSVTTTGDVAATVAAEVMTRAEVAAQSTPLPGWARSWAATPAARAEQATAQAARQAESLARGRAQAEAARAEEAAQLQEAATRPDAQLARFSRVIEAAWGEAVAPVEEAPEEGPGRQLMID